LILNLLELSLMIFFRSESKYHQPTYYTVVASSQLAMDIR